MAKKQTEIATSAKGSIMEANPIFSRRKMLGITGMAGLAALTGISADAVAHTQPKKPRIAVIATFWGATRSHADWLVNKLIDGYWWQGAYVAPRVEVVFLYLHQ